jgi:predicted alpha/beta hydrolase
MSRFRSLKINSSNGINIAAKHWSTHIRDDSKPLVIFVHQWGVLGGCGQLMEGIANIVCSKGYDAITFDLRGVGRSSGAATYSNKVSGSQHYQHIR